jgi:cytochrome c oxidase accessory protein FixG
MNQAVPTHSVIKIHAARQEIYPRAAKGRFATWRWICVWLTQLVFYSLPWLSWNGRQAVLFDLTERKFYIFGLVLWPQDFIYLALLLIICASALFLVTAVAGRVWCGFACPQTVYTEIFMWIEQKIEGSRSARILLAKQPWSVAKLTKKSAKHLAWAAVALWTGFTFVGYFTPILVLAGEVMTLGLGPWEWFWVLFYGFATYGNAGWMREQVCKYMCPYARFQSSMFDRDTLTVTYDKQRGEPRGALAKSAAKSSAGSCIDCSMCVQVCPTGIDIRNGLQHDCIGCAACIDACDSVMDKIGAPRGLVRFSSDNALENRLSPQQIRQRTLRPRVLIYSGALLLIVAGFIGSLLMHTPLKLDVMRDRGALGRIVEDGMVENVYRLQITNTEETAHRYRIKVSGIDSIALATPDQVDLAGTEARTVPVRVRVAPGKGEPGSNKIAFTLQATDNERLQVKENAAFLMPRR